MRSHLELNNDPSENLAILGDFNVAPEDRDVWDINSFKGATHVSKPERDAYFKVLDWGLIDSLRDQCPDEAGVYTFWDYRQGSFYKKMGMRIDFILPTIAMHQGIETIVVDRNARKGEKPSDHAPVVADFSLT